MKVLLLKDVLKIGKKGEVKDVNQGHAMNFLVPRKLARVVSDSEIKSIKVRHEQDKKYEEMEKDLAIKNLVSLKGKKVTLKEKANDKGHLFSKIHEEEIIKAILDQLKISLPKNSLKLKSPIKETGEISVTLELFDKKVELNLIVESL